MKYTEVKIYGISEMLADFGGFSKAVGSLIGFLSTILLTRKFNKVLKGLEPDYR